MSRTPPSATALRVADLNQNADNSFAVRPDAATLLAIAAELELTTLRKLVFEGRVVSQGEQDWRLEAHLGATVVQPCVVTLEPVMTRIDATITRQFIRDPDFPDDDAEVEIPDDDSIETLGPWIDPAQVMIEALALEVPDYPRKDAATLGQMIYTKPGEAPMTDEDARPFAGLAALKDQLKDGE